ncbi:hypothetical protein O9993_08445 [Vibrio lentus]|nr:hypothetical protein [Vibrio lentus]
MLKGAKTFTIVNKDVLDKVAYHGPRVVQFIELPLVIPGVRPQLMIVRQMLSRLNGNTVSSLTVSETGIKTLKMVAPRAFSVRAARRTSRPYCLSFNF